MASVCTVLYSTCTIGRLRTGWLRTVSVNGCRMMIDCLYFFVDENVYVLVNVRYKLQDELYLRQP